MSQDHRLQQQRFELKYLIDEAISPSIRDFLSSYLELDEYGAERPNFSYPVHSLYLDSDDLKTYQSSVNGTKNRFKMRLRYYDGGAESPVFFEIKARVDDCILKQRCGVRREAVPLLLAGQLPDPDQLFSREARHVTTLERFNLLLHQLNARPKAHNNYLREAWVSPHDNSIRVTFDRQIRIEPCFVAHAPIAMENPMRVFPDVTVLELKFTNRFPNWFQELVRVFHLMRFSSAKYAEGVLLLGEEKFHDGDESFDWQQRSPQAEFGWPQSSAGILI
jgi:SPX domain protein involved in polyphosphate accumulation